MNSLQRLFILFIAVIVGIDDRAEGQPPVRPGDRIAIIGNTFADQLRVHGYLETLLIQYSDQQPVSVRNLGWGGDMLDARDRPTNFPTEESTLTAHKTDVIIACFGMGESFAGDDGVADFKSNVRALIDAHAGKQYNGKTPVRLILVSPIACEDQGDLTPARKSRNRQLATYTDAMSQVASAAEIPFVDLFEPTRYLMDEPTGPKLTTNGIHLNDFGYWAVSRILFDNLVGVENPASQGPWRIFIDAETVSESSGGVSVSDVKRLGSVLTFRVDEIAAATPRPPTKEMLPPPLNHQRDTLTINGLDSGDYLLSIDGERVVVASHSDWAGGVAVDSSPSHKRAELLRQSINDKNLQFTYSWKALNQVHIVGERRSSPSGRMLPSEVIEFNRIANERDQQLGQMARRNSRTWRVERIAP